jgi:hypothetical protein
MTQRIFYTGPSLERLHQEYGKQGRIDTNAPITTFSEIIIHAPVDVVWQQLVDLANWPNISPAFRDVRLDSTVAVDETFRFTLYNFPIRATIAVVEPGRKLVWTGVSLWFKAIDMHELEATADGNTRYTVSESFAGLLATLFTSSEQLRKQHQAWQSAFKRAVEERSGQS